MQTELVEALLRWRQPGEIVLPGEFLDVAEASGLILQINDWVLRRVIETAARWHHGAWPAVRVAINVSSRQLFNNSFVDRVQALLNEHKIAAALRGWTHRERFADRQRNHRGPAPPSRPWDRHSARRLRHRFLVPFLPRTAATDTN